MNAPQSESTTQICQRNQLDTHILIKRHVEARRYPCRVLFCQSKVTTTLFPLETQAQNNANISSN